MLIVSMGVPHKNINRLEEGRRFTSAIIQIIDWKKKKVIKEINYKSPPENLKSNLSQMFKGAYIYKESYYIVTNTELLEYNINTWKLENVITHQTFNDLHGVFVDDKYIYICNTGLELVQIIKDNEIVRNMNMADTPTWERFDKTVDYREIPNTKPHEAHINQIFLFNNELWVTRFQQRDAVSLYDKNKRIVFPYDVGCHDGFIKNSAIFFTMVNGHIIKVDSKTCEVIKDFNVNTMHLNNIGWTRGLEVDGDNAYLGISAMRHSKFKEYAKGIIKGKKNRKMPSSILEIDLKREKILDSLTMPYHKAAVYTIFKYPEV